MAYIETTTLRKTVFRLTVWKCYIDDIFPYGTEVNQTSKPSWNKQTYITKLLKWRPKIWHWDCVFRHDCTDRGTRFKEKSILDAETHFKQTETFLHTHFTWCHPPSVEKRICQRRSLENPTKKLLRNNLWRKTFKCQKTLDGQRLPLNLDRKLTCLSEIKFTERESILLKQNLKEEKEILPFVTQYQPSVSTIKEAWMTKWNLTQDQQ